MKNQLIRIQTALETLAEQMHDRMMTMPEAGATYDRIYRAVTDLIKQCPPDKTMSMEIISMTRDNTRNSGSPFWRCATDSGIMVNVFRHDDPLRDTFHLFDEAGFAAPMVAMQYGETIGWQKDGITVDCVDSGGFWKVVAVTAREPGQHPDPDDDNEPEPF